MTVEACHAQIVKSDIVIKKRRTDGLVAASHAKGTKIAMTVVMTTMTVMTKIILCVGIHFNCII